MPKFSIVLKAFVLSAMTAVAIACGGGNDEGGSDTTAPGGEGGTGAVQTTPRSGRTELQHQQITARDFSFDFEDEIDGGLTRFSMANEGAEPHQATILRLNDGVTPEQLEASLSPNPDNALALTGRRAGPTPSRLTPR